MLTWHKIYPNASHPNANSMGKHLCSKLIHYIDFSFQPFVLMPKVPLGNLLLIRKLVIIFFRQAD